MTLEGNVRVKMIGDVKKCMSGDISKPTKRVYAQRRLRSVFAVSMKKPWVLSYPLSASEDSYQRSDWADLCLHFVGFVM